MNLELTILNKYKWYADPFYHVLLLLVFHGLKTKQDVFVNHAMLLILSKLWNGRKSDFIKYCDERVMRYVTTNMISAKHLIHTHTTPLNLLSNYFVPTIIKKYGPEILKDPLRLKNLFMQSYARIYQIFSQNVRINPKTGTKEASGGLAPMYYQAYRAGLTVSNPTIKTGEDGEQPGYDEYATTHIRDEIAETTTDFIVLNSNPNYPDSFISTVNKTTKVSSKVLVEIFKSLHNHKYHDLIYDLFVLMLGKLDIKEKSDICKSGFMLDIKKKIISSKNNPEAMKIQKLLDTLLIDIFKNLKPNPLKFEVYSNVQKIQIRTSIVHSLIYHLRRNICHSQITSASYTFS